ncbi:hypothetical protein NZK35_03710 [Stieleria sp. ICT_E10.1]|uniref:hypothetical protein n=1 Tax=Stieleria sedimenti TaxID=2976331 RepID=UPI00218090FF|nr:hypothetical protein [Stieleria sedimenti]MCS7465781.1 hypothetical protein [Stieleria sedimenti]
MTASTAAYAILKPGTTAADLTFLPNPVVGWLDENFNFRTFVMTLGVCLVPAFLLASGESDNVRRRLLSVALIVLVSLEFIQLWIPTRRFGWADVGYTFAGVAAAEVLVLLARRVGSATPPASGKGCSV